MPTNVRNFWIEATIDGRKANLAGGPQSKNGGFELTIRQRNAGGIVRALEVKGYVGDDGSLKLWAECPVTGQRMSFVTSR